MGGIHHNYEEQKATLLLANADYEAQKAEKGHSLSMRAVERFWKLPAGKLSNYRANHRRRRYGAVKAVINYPIN